MLAASKGCLKLSKAAWLLSKRPHASMLSQLTSSPPQPQSGLISTETHESFHDFKETEEKKPKQTNHK